MNHVHGIQYKNNSKEELFPDFGPDFPYTCSYVEFGLCIGGQIPWHWHKEIELFYIEKGTLEYDTPGGKIVFPEGSGGMVNSAACWIKSIFFRSPVPRRRKYSAFIPGLQKKRGFLSCSGIPFSYLPTNLDMKYCSGRLSLNSGVLCSLYPGLF